MQGSRKGEDEGRQGPRSIAARVKQFRFGFNHVGRDVKGDRAQLPTWMEAVLPLTHLKQMFIPSRFSGSSGEEDAASSRGSLFHCPLVLRLRGVS